MIDSPDPQLSEAVVKYLGFGSHSWPQSDCEAVVGMVGVDRALPLCQAIDDLITDLGNTRIDWTTTSEDLAVEMVTSDMRQKHAYLSSDALDALIWKLTYNWR